MERACSVSTLATIPNFVIAGERRCGTTSLYHAMRRHPQIYLHPVTDMNYFTDDEIAGRRWRDGEVDKSKWEQSHTLEDYSALFEEGEDYPAKGHKGADLLYWRPAHPRLERFIPDARYIITLRNPINRAWSHYWNEVGKGRETLSFQEALAAEEERSSKSDYARFHLSYLDRGFYHKSLQAFFQYVSPARVVVVTVEQTKLQPEETLAEIYRFLGVDPSVGLEGAGMTRNQNWTLLPRKWTNTSLIKPVESIYTRITEKVITSTTTDPEMRRNARRRAQVFFRKPAGNIAIPEKIRRQLSNTYAPHISALEELLGRSFPEWGF